MASKVVAGMAATVAVGIILLNLTPDPTQQVSLYQNVLESELSRQLDGSFQPALLLISRTNVTGEVRTRLYDLYAGTRLQLQFVEPDQLTLAKLTALDRQQYRTVHSFVFSQIHYRNGWPGFDVHYLSSGGRSYQYTVHLQYTGSQWRIVEKIALPV
jgi:hypothetical protein